MTSNQINYHKLLEDRRHNRVVEKETKRANLVNAKNTRRAQDIQKEYNSAYIGHLSSSLEETHRHNLATESKDLLHLTRSLAETERHNKVSEGLSAKQISNTYDIGLGNLNLGRSQLSENQRHSQEMERLTSINNEYNYTLGTERNAIENLKRADSARINTQQQLLQTMQQSETQRHNIRNEQLTDRQHTITAVTNLSSQLNNWYRSLTE